ncbi:MAG: elongation factor Ts [Geminicoccaceae bacterium]|nr:elongation factor Ts [Geminicoccaceae bacterium]
MAAITSAMVKELRERTGAGMMDCKKALGETDGDMEQSVDWLRKKGLAAAAKKAGRTTSEGLIGLAIDGTTGALVEVNSETDFVARNETFQQLVRDIAEAAPAAKGDPAALKAARLPSGRTVEEEIAQAIGVIGENISLRRTGAVEVEDGVVGGYVHAQQAPGLGKIGVIVGLRSSGDRARLAELGKQVAMHVAAANPQAVDVEGVDPATVEREKAIFKDQARASGKPESIIEKMVEGRLRKFYEESVLLEQVFVIDTDRRVKEAVAAVAKEIGASIEVTSFVRMALGEGIEKQESDLAAEVAKLTGQ